MRLLIGSDSPHAVANVQSPTTPFPASADDALLRAKSLPRPHPRYLHGISGESDSDAGKAEALGFGSRPTIRGSTSPLGRRSSSSIGFRQAQSLGSSVDMVGRLGGVDCNQTGRSGGSIGDGNRRSGSVMGFGSLLAHGTRRSHSPEIGLNDGRKGSVHCSRGGTAVPRFPIIFSSASGPPPDVLLAKGPNFITMRHHNLGDSGRQGIISIKV